MKLLTMCILMIAFVNLPAFCDEPGGTIVVNVINSAPGASYYIPYLDNVPGPMTDISDQFTYDDVPAGGHTVSVRVFSFLQQALWGQSKEVYLYSGQTKDLFFFGP